MTYEVRLPFDNAKLLENALAQLPGDSQEVRFDGQGNADVTIFGAHAPLEVSVSTSSDGKHAERSLMAEPLCGAISAVNGSLTDVSIRSVGYEFDDGKLRVPSVP